ncbi:stemmadenine O-acetyltransferase-like [Euphorbia lathyris]|uniref:stemmadenine O-acetyltransferase-like n=1 Tax=Euphorbia lathyris TaxID=212925 RepID=UPI0033134938
MVLEVEFISKELIKPSVPTPNHLRKHKFSFIDQNQFPISIPILLFYEKSNIPNHERCNLLKQSLSKALTIFYPLAGRINNYSYADCNDEGALFIQTKANCQLSEILLNRNEYHNHNKKFFPLQPEKGVHQYGSLFQITYFNCGGLGVSFAMPHMLGDGLSMFTFLNCWAAVARGNTLEIPPIVSDSIFPPIKIAGFDLTQWAFKENVVTKSFVFDAATISALTDKYSANGEKLSRVLALSVFILSRMIATTSQAKNNRCMVIYSVNVRELLNPPLSKQSFGNLIFAAPALIDNVDPSGNKEDAYYEIGKRIKDSITSVNSESLRKLQNGELNFTKESFMECINGEIDRYSFTSLCRFPMYEVDFGWGKPEWVAISMVFINNFIMLCDTRNGKGIEVWISLTEEDMAKFEKDKQLLSNLSSTPNENNPNLNSRL